MVKGRKGQTLRQAQGKRDGRPADDKASGVGGSWRVASLHAAVLEAADLVAGFGAGGALDGDFGAGGAGADPFDEAADFGVFEEFVAGVVVVFELLFGEGGVDGFVAGGAEPEDALFDFVPVEVLLVAFVLVAGLGDEVVFVHADALAEAELAAVGAGVGGHVGVVESMGIVDGGLSAVIISCWSQVSHGSWRRGA